MQSVDQMASFVELWDLVQAVQLSDGQDTISWRWTSDGAYTAKSAYSAQFLGSYSNFRGLASGKQKRKGSMIFFAWLLLQCARYSQQINWLQNDGLVVQPAPCALKNPRWHPISPYTARLPDRCGRRWKLGHKI